MNLLLLLVGLRPWSAVSSTSLVTRVFVAVSVLSVEMQVATWFHLGTLRDLPIVNGLIAVLAFVVGWRRDARTGRSDRRESWWLDDRRDAVPMLQAVPWPALLVLGALVLALAVALPLTAADPYHFDKVALIERTGTLAYDPAADVKINILNSTYELLIADVRQLPLVGPGLIRLHGLAGFLLYLAAIGAVRELLRSGPGWRWAAMLTVPVVFHQLVLVKNDLLVGAPSLVILGWIVTRSQRAPLRELAWASWLAGLVVAVKLTSLPLLVLVAAAAALRYREGWRPFVGAALGAVAGLSCGGLPFLLVQNVRTYGELLPIAGMGSQFSSMGERLVGLGRFGISLVDLGLLTRAWWPGRGGWGGTFGLPLIWALAVLIVRARHVAAARAALACGGLYFLAFGGAFPDADVAQRLAMAPGLLLLAVALASLPERRGARRVAEATLALTILLSTAQIARSAVLYVLSGPT